MKKKHLIALLALVVALVLPVTLITVSLASDTVAEIADGALSYEGVAAKAVTRPGVRSMWRINNKSISALEEKGYDVYYGALMALKSATLPNGEALSVICDPNAHKVSADTSRGKVGAVTVYASEKTGVSGSNKFVETSEDYSVFAFTTTFDFDDKPLFDADIVYAGWLVTVSPQGDVAYYYDYPTGTALASRLDTYEKNNTLYYSAFNLSAVCDYFVNEYRSEEGSADFAGNTIMNTVVDELRAIRIDDLSVGFASGKSTHVGTGINLVSGLYNTYLLRVNVAETGYYSVRIRYALADSEKATRVYLRSRLDATSVSTFVSENAATAIATDGGYTVPEGTDYAEQKLYVYLTAGEHFLDLWTESETTAAISSLLLRCDRAKSDLSFSVGIQNYEVRTNGHDVVQHVASDASKPAGNYALRGYLSDGASITTVNPTRLGYAVMKTGSYFDYTVSVATPGYYELIGDVGIGENSALYIYDITDEGLTTGGEWSPHEGLTPIFTANKATSGGAASRVTESLGDVRLKAGTRKLRVYVEGDVSYRQLFFEKNGVNYLTVNYVDESGKTVAPQKLVVLDRYTTYNIPSPVIANYTADQKTVSGVLTGDRTVTVIYTAAADISDRTVTFIYGFAGEHKENVTVANGETLTAPAASAIDGYYLLWNDAYGMPVYDLSKVGDGATLVASYEKTATVEAFAGMATVSGVAHFVEGDATQIMLYDSASSSGYFSTGGYMRMSVTVPYSGVYALRVKAASSASQFEIVTRVNNEVISINGINSTAFVKDGGILDEAGKAAAYTSAAQTWVYLKEGTNTLDICTRNAQLSVYSAELRLVTEMTDKSDVAATLITKAGASGASGDGKFGTYLNTKNGYIEYAVNIPKDGVYSLYFLLATQAVGQNSNVTVTDVTTGRTIANLVGMWSNHYRGMYPVKAEAVLEAGTHTFRITSNVATRTNTVGVVAVRTDDIVHHNVTFNYGENTVVNSVITGYTTTPPAAEKDGYRLEWLDEEGNVVTDFSSVIITSDRVFTANYIDIEADVTFVYGDESETVTVSIGDTVTPPDDRAEKEGFALVWLDEEGNKVTDFSSVVITDDRTFTAEYIDYKTVEVFAINMTPKGNCSFLDDDPSILILKNGGGANDGYVRGSNYISVPVTVYKTGIYRVGLRGRANTYFDFIIHDGTYYNGTNWSNVGSTFYANEETIDYSAIDKNGAYKYGGNTYLYLEAGKTYNLLCHTRQTGTDKVGDVALYSMIFELSHEIYTGKKTPDSTNNTGSNGYYGNGGQCLLKDATSYFTYNLTLEPGTYTLIGLAGNAGQNTYTYAVTDANGNPVETVKTANATYGSYKHGSKPAVATSNVTITENGTYTVKVSCTSTNFGSGNNFVGIFAEKMPEYDVTFVYGEESVTVSYLKGAVAIPPAEAAREDYAIKWRDESGNFVSDFTVTGKATYTAEYVDAKNLEIFATEMTPHGSSHFLDADPSILVIANGGGYTSGSNYVTIPVTVYKTGIYKVGVRGKADAAGFDFIVKKGQYHSAIFGTSGSTIYQASTDYTMTEAEKAGAYKYGSPTMYLYLEAGKTYNLVCHTRQHASAGAVGIYSMMLSLTHEIAAGKTLPNSHSAMSNNSTYGNTDTVRFGSAAAYGDYQLTLDIGTYTLIGLAGNVSSGGYQYVVMDANGNTVATVKTPNAQYGNYKNGSVPAVASQTVTITEGGTYTVRVTMINNTRYDANSFYGVYAKKLPSYDVTFNYGDESVTSALQAGAVAVPPVAANKAGYLLEWLDDSGNVVTDFTVSGNAVYTARYNDGSTLVAVPTGEANVYTVTTPRAGWYRASFTPADDGSSAYQRLYSSALGANYFTRQKKISLDGWAVYLAEGENTLTYSATAMTDVTLVRINERGGIVASGYYAPGGTGFTASGGVDNGWGIYKLDSAGDYITIEGLTVETAGTYYLDGLIGLYGSGETYTVTIKDSSGNEVKRFDCATPAGGNAEGSSGPSNYVGIGEVALEADNYSVTITMTAGNTVGINSVMLSAYDVTFNYDDESVTSALQAGAVAVPPVAANKAGYLLEWLDDSSNVVTDFTVSGNAVYTARYIPITAQNYTMNTLFTEETIKTNGRTGTDGNGIICDNALAGFEMNVRFVGDLTLTVTAKNPTNSTTADGPADAYFTVYIDGVRSATRFCFAAGETTTLTIATSDGTKMHHIRVVKQNEAQFVLTTLESLSFTGYFGAKPEDKDLYIEFMGDSISTGWGNLGEYGMADQHQPLYQDATQGYFNLVAEALDADASLSGCAGIGMLYGGYAVLPQFTEFYAAQSYFRDKTVATEQGRTPDMIIMSLGTNDLRYGATEDEFKESMLAFIDTLREGYGDVPVVLVYGQMTTRLATVMPAIEAASENVYVYELERNEAGGGGHPDVQGGLSAKAELLAAMRADGLIH